MPVLKFKRFNKPHVLKRIGRGLLAEFFAKFQEDSAGVGLVLPEPNVSDSDYFQVLAGLLMGTGTGGNLVSDAHLAALAVEHDATIVAFDHDFSRFPGVRWREPAPM